MNVGPTDYELLGPEEPPGDAGQFDLLIRKYAPVYAVFPEGSGGDPPPYPGGRSDYHPRAVGVYLDNADLIEPRGRRAVLGATIVAFVVALATFVAPSLVPDIMRVYSPYLIGIVQVASFFGTLLVVLLQRGYVGVEKMRVRLATALPGGLPYSTLSYAGAKKRPSPADVWERYLSLIQSTTVDGAPRYERTVYVHVVENSRDGRYGSSLVIEYWTFYYYNHWGDRHEADWESIALYFADDRTEPKAAAYSNHLGCLWRAWGDVKKWHDGLRPLVFVAIGSHANFFEPRAEGYEPVFAWRVPGLIPGWVPLLGRARSRLSGRLAARTGAERDYVPNVPLPLREREFSARYKIDVAPDDVTLQVDPAVPANADIWEHWWWLRFAGNWARFTDAQAILGPAQQDLRWSRPYGWALEGQADANWDRFFASPRAATIKISEDDPSATRTGMGKPDRDRARGLDLR